jgi:adenylyltransferase/sulfurtransferase
VLVIGGGGLGSIVIPALAAAGIGTIGVIDDDTVELSNLHRQPMHGIDNIGAFKTASAAETVAATDPTTTVRQYPVRLTASNALELFDGFDLVIDGSDNFPTRYLANDAAALVGIPLVWGSVLQYGGQASVAWSEKGPTYRDLFPTPPPADSVLSCEVGGVLPSVVAVIGSVMANEAIKIITGIGQPLVGRVTTFDALTGGFRELAFERDPEAWEITGLIDYDAFCGMPSADETITAARLAHELDSNDPPVLIDVREVWEAAIAALPDALLVPLETLEAGIGGLDPHREVVVYCHHGIRSATALELLRSRGFATARHLEGGIDAWARQIDPAMARY